MKIQFLKINGFGKIKNKEIELNNNINLIYGKNESGKTTLLKFIYGMFFGASKNKNGKEICDFEKYKPWNGDNFSGKLKYILDNNEEIEVYREFKKKNPKIYNKNSEEISSNFSMDKTKGNQFFYEQTGIDEDLFINTTMVQQQEVALTNQGQNILTQKIANILSTGDNNISYKKAIEKLNKKLIEDVGTDRTTDRPINQIEEKMQNVQNRIKEIENDVLEKEEIRLRKIEINNKIKEIENRINLIKEIKLNEEKVSLEKEKIKINNNIKEEYIEKIDNLKTKLKINKIEKKSNKNNILELIIISTLIILNILINIFKINQFIEKAIVLITIIYLIFYLIKVIKNRLKTNKIKINNNLEINKIKSELELLEENKDKKEKEIYEINNLLNNEINRNNILIKNKFKNSNIEEINKLLELNIENINNKLQMEEDELGNFKINLNTIEIKEKDILNKLEKRASYEEELSYLQEQKNELLSLKNSINISIEIMEEAYSKIKEDITPKFTKDLSILSNKISNGKYKNIVFNDENGLMVENENGEYINCNKLSIGTIDQLYLSLRISAISEISKETMPIILDEAFAYYDTERLENILKYLNENYKNNQIIIFSCSNREKEILNKLAIDYNFVEL